jgi:hypothetical protein
VRKRQKRKTVGRQEKTQKETKKKRKEKRKLTSHGEFTGRKQDCAVLLQEAHGVVVVHWGNWADQAREERNKTKKKKQHLSETNETEIFPAGADTRMAQLWRRVSSGLPNPSQLRRVETEAVKCACEPNKKNKKNKSPKKKNK